MAGNIQVQFLVFSLTMVALCSPGLPSNTNDI